jgi:hypothetical protein
MSGSNPINNQPKVQLPPRQAARGEQEAVEVPKDSVELRGAQASEPKIPLTVRMEVTPEQYANIEHLTPVLVPENQAGADRPVVVQALPDPPAVDGYKTMASVAYVPAEQVKDENATQEFLANHTAHFIRNGSLVVTEQELEHDRNVYREMGKQEGKKEAIPDGFKLDLDNSPTSAKLEMGRNMGSMLLGMGASATGGLALASGVGAPLSVAVPLSFLGPALGIFGPTGTMSTMMDISKRTQALELGSRKDGQPLTAEEAASTLAAFNPMTLKGSTVAEARDELNFQHQTQVAKTAGYGLLAAAGVSELAGFGPMLASLTGVGALTYLVPALAWASMATPLADQALSVRTMGDVGRRKKEIQGLIDTRLAELNQAKSEGKETASVRLPHLAPNGRLLGFSNKEVPIDEAIKSVKEGQEPCVVAQPITDAQGQQVGFGEKEAPIKDVLLQLRNNQSVLLGQVLTGASMTGIMVASGFGLPLMAVGIASVALMQLKIPQKIAEFLVFPKEVLTSIWEAIKGVGQRIAGAFGLGEEKGEGDQPAVEVSPAQQKLRDAFAGLAKENPKLAGDMQQALTGTVKSLRDLDPKNPDHEKILAAAQRVIVESANEFDAMRKFAHEKHPEAAAALDAAIKEVEKEEQGKSAQAQQQLIDGFQAEAKRVAYSPMADSLLQSDAVKKALADTQAPPEVGRGVLQDIAFAQMTSQDLEGGLRNSPHPQAKAFLHIYEAIVGELERTAVQQAEQQPAVAVAGGGEEAPAAAPLTSSWQMKDGRLQQVWG